MQDTQAEKVRRDWRIPDELWARIEPLLPPRKAHPLGCHRLGRNRGGRLLASKPHSDRSTCTH
jgi:transposase